MLKGKTVCLGVTGSIAAYKIASLASMLVKLEADVHVIMTKNATNFINPITFETLTRNKCLVDTFDRDFEFNVEHVSLAKKADVFMIAPASANVIGKIANGIADDMLTTTVMATKAPVYISPTMNTGMYENPILQDNLKKLKSYGYNIIDPATGFLACRDLGAGKMPEPERLLSYILKEIACTKDLSGKKILVSAGPTEESFDPVRFITNHSTGKMGYAIARAAMLRGASVTLVSGPTNIEAPPFVHVVNVKSAEEMANAVLSKAEDMDAFFLTAAVADYSPDVKSNQKIKKMNDDLTISLKPTRDILKTLGEEKREEQFLCGFCMETEDLAERAKGKLKKKNADMIVANSLNTEGAGFGTDTNVVTIVTRGKDVNLPILPKEELAHKIIDKYLELYN